MPAGESRQESFDESVAAIAERVRIERREGVSAEQEVGDDRRREAELKVIRAELRELFGDIGGSGDDGDGRGEEVDSTDALQPAQLDDTEAASYLDTVPERYKEPAVALLQFVAQGGGIAKAVAKAQRKNDPYFVDVFHDSLAQFLHQKMQDQGLL